MQLITPWQRRRHKSHIKKLVEALGILCCVLYMAPSHMCLVQVVSLTMLPDNSQGKVHVDIQPSSTAAKLTAALNEQPPPQASVLQQAAASNRLSLSDDQAMLPQPEASSSHHTAQHSTPLDPVQANMDLSDSEDDGKGEI
jgi:hypothetical protein